MQKTQMTTRGVRYSTESYHYPDKLSTLGRTQIKAIAPGGHMIAVTVRSSGSAYHTFSPKDSDKKSLYMPGSIEYRGGQVFFHPRREDHLEMLYKWDRERIPSDHVPLAVEAIAVAAE